MKVVPRSGSNTEPTRIDRLRFGLGAPGSRAFRLQRDCGFPALTLESYRKIAAPGLQKRMGRAAAGAGSVVFPHTASGLLS